MEPTRAELLKDPRVIDEIKRHLWIESEVVGKDVGFEKAAEDWLNRFSREWMRYHLPENLKASRRKPKSK